jgi:hypothetical protein
MKGIFSMERTLPIFSRALSRLDSLNILLISVQGVHVFLYT